MSDTPKFEVVDRRKMKAEEEKDERTAAEVPAAVSPAAMESSVGPRLVVNEPALSEEDAATAEESEQAGDPALPPAPTAEESSEQKAAYDASTQRLEDLIRAQNPAAGPQPPVTFEHLAQQLYVTAMIQMGAAAQEGQRPRVDILGARTTIDLLGILAEKTKGNLTSTEERVLQTVLFELRMAFLEITSMMTVPSVPPSPPAGKK